MRRLALALLGCTALTALSWAAETPRPGTRDPTMRTQPYRADTRIQLIGTLRRSTTITFGSDESVVRVILGDDDILEGPDPSTQGSSPLRHHLPLWPKRAGRTNFQVITSAPGRPDRLYQFVMVVRDAPADGDDDPEATYGLTFTYPAQRPPAQESERVARQERQEAERVAARLSPVTGPAAAAQPGSAYINYRYVARGDRDLAPVAIGDDAVETIIVFHPSFPVPAVFWVNHAGGVPTEHAMTLDRRGMAFVAHGIYEVLRLRSGAKVLDIHNVGYAQSAQQQAAWEVERRGTTRRGVVRDVRRSQAR